MRARALELAALDTACTWSSPAGSSSSDTAGTSDSSAQLRRISEWNCLERQQIPVVSCVSFPEYVDASSRG